MVELFLSIYTALLPGLSLALPPKRKSKKEETREGTKSIKSEGFSLPTNLIKLRLPGAETRESLRAHGRLFAAAWVDSQMTAYKVWPISAPLMAYVSYHGCYWETNNMGAIGEKKME